MKRCPRCSTDKPITEFAANRHQSDGLQPWCRSCKTAHQRVYRKTDAGKATIERDRPNVAGRMQRYLRSNKGKQQRITQTIGKYGLTPDQYQRLVVQQDGVCAICKQPCITHTRLSVDHDHRSGKVRGLLCDRHNRGIGYFQDDPTLLREAAAYLEAHQ